MEDTAQDYKQNSGPQDYTLSQLPSADPAALAAAEAAKQRIQAAYQMAIHRPRNQEQSRQNILAACQRPRFAESVRYRKKVGTEYIEGPSIRFAELALREWRNILSDQFVVYEDKKIRRIKVIITDLETNAQFSKEISVAKTVERRNNKGREVIATRQNSNNQTVYVVVATDEEMQTKEAALISKAVRNEGLRLIPSDIIEEALDVAVETLKHRDKEEPDAQRKKIADNFFTIGITVSDLEQYLGHKLANSSPAEIQNLRDIFTAIKSGEATWKEYVIPDKAEAPKASDILNQKPKPAPAPKAEKKATEPAPKQEKEPVSKEQPSEPELTAVEQIMAGAKTAKIKLDDLREYAESKGLDYETESHAKKLLDNWDKVVEDVKLGASKN